jgi:hypothetical protein
MMWGHKENTLIPHILHINHKPWTMGIICHPNPKYRWPQKYGNQILIQ